MGVKTKLEDLRISEAASDLYSFVWNDFCDWYLEFSKLRTYGEDLEEKQSALTVLCYCLDHIIKLLHPFVPFVTEEIYSYLPSKDQESLALSAYPESTDLNINEDFINDTDLIKECITAVRNIRGENQIKVSQALKVFIIPKDEKSQKALQTHKASLKKMALLEELSFEQPETFKNSAVNQIKIEKRNVDVVVPLEGLVDIGEEIKRIKKVMSKVEGDLQLTSKKLSNERYLKNAPEELVEEDKRQVAVFENKLKFYKEHLSRLSVEA